MYEKLTAMDVEIEEAPVLDVNGQTVYGEKALKWEKAFYDSGFAVQNYEGVLQTAGVSFDSNDPDDYDIEVMDAKVVLALLTNIVRSERFCEGTVAACVESGLIGALVGRLEEIDYENRPLSAWIEQIADQTLADLQDLPRDEETTVGYAIQPHLQYEDEHGEMRERPLSAQDEFDIVDAIQRKAKNYGLYLDSSAYDDTIIGLPINIPFRVRKVPIGSDGPAMPFRFQCGGFFGGYPTLEVYQFADETVAKLFNGDPRDPQRKTFEVTDAQLKGLWAVLAEIGAMAWEAEYNDFNVLDGTQWELSFTLEGKHYHFKGSNAFPEGFDTLVDYLNKTFECEF